MNEKRKDRKSMRSERLKKLGEILEKSVAEQEIAGANLCVIHKGQEIYYAEAGYANISQGKKMKRDTIVRLYSMSKPVTAAAVMLLAERGVIDLWDPLEKYIPAFANAAVTADRVADIGAVRVKRSITVKDCMNMTSGLPYGDDPDVASRDVGAVFRELDRRLYSENPMTTVEFAERLGGCRLDFQPGEGFRYGTSADVLGAVVEVASGMRFGEFLEKEFFVPLGMKDTGFSVPEDKRERLATVYEWTPDGLTEFHDNRLGICNHMDTKIAFESGGAGLVSTIEDYWRFTQMLMQRGSFDGKEILAPKTAAYMTGSHLQPHQQIMLKDWENLYGFSYGNLMRVLVDPALTIFNASAEEYGWDGWLGPYFANMPKEETTFLMMVQRKDSGTFTLTRKLRNALAAAME